MPKWNFIGLTMAFEEIGDSYENFAQGLRESGINLPSLKVLIAIILGLVLVLALLVSLNPFQSKFRDVEISVKLEKKPVDKALLQILDLKGNILQEELTDETGIAIFKDLPNSGLKVKASKRGVFEKTKALPDMAKTFVINADEEKNQTSNASVEITLLVLDEASQKSLEGASITYTFSDDPKNTFKATTGKDGNALLNIPADKTMNLIVFHTNYDSKPATIAGSDSKRKFQIQLIKNNLPAPSVTPTVVFEYSTLRVSVKDTDGKILQSAVELYDAGIKSKISSKATIDGKASFPSLLSGSKFYLIVKASGYSDYDGSLSPFVIGKTNQIEIALKKGTANSKIKVSTIDEEGIAVASKLIIVKDEESVLEKSSRGSEEFDRAQLSGLESFSVLAIANGKLPAQSEIYTQDTAPKEINLVMIDATDENSADLAINTLDKDGKSIENVAIKIFSDLKGVVYLGKIASDKLAIKLEKGQNYQILGSVGGVSGTAQVFLDGNKEVSLFVGASVEHLQVSAFDAFTDDPLDATFYSIYAGKTFDTCYGEKCNLFAKTLQETSLKITAMNYYDRETALLPSSEGKPIEFALIPKSIDQTLVKFVGIFNSIGRKVLDLEAGEEYSAKFLVAGDKADRLGMQFRIGKEASAQNDVAYLIGAASSVLAISKISSGVFSQASSCSDDSLQNKEYKWMNLEFGADKPVEVAFSFKLKNNAERVSEIQMYYFGYAIKNGEYLRQPVDDELGSKEKTAAKDKCKSKTNQIEFPIKKSGQFSCNALGCLSLLVEQDGISSFRDAQARSAKNCVTTAGQPNSCESANMKIQIVFAPNDPSKEFDFQIHQKDAKVKLTSFSLNSQPVKEIGLSSYGATLSGEKEYNIDFDSLPMEAGAERISISVQEATSDASIGRNLDLKIYESCEDGLKKCGGDLCSLICLGDYFDSGNDEEEIPPAPTCDEGKFYCSDGECRSSCLVPSENNFASEVKIDLVDGKLQVANSKIKMQIDSLLPADAIPIKFDGAGKCTALYEIVAGSTKPCYSIENNVLVFRGSELSQNCPLKSVGDNALGDNSAKLKVVCTAVGLNPIELPIEVSVKKLPFKAVSMLPRQISGSASKLFHIISQKQVPKDYTMEDLQIEFQNSDASSFAWSGAGTLELREEDTPVESITYSSSDTYFPSIDNQGGRTPACYDYGCCSSKWCTQPAASQAFAKFKTAAAEAAKASVFRRGNNYLQEKVLQKPFVFTTVMRLIQNANLPSGITVEDTASRYGCLNENPKIYVVQASTEDGINFEYRARIARLYKLNYVSSEELCKNGDLTPELAQSSTHGYQSPGNYLPLCDFLKSDKKCVQNEQHASFASIEQAATKKQLMPSYAVSTFWRINVFKQFAPPGGTLVDMDLPDWRVFRFATMTCPAGSVGGEGCWCTPKQSYVFSDVSDNQIRANIHVGINAKCKMDYTGLAIGAAGYMATYKYPEHANTINTLASLVSFAIAGDFSTCATLEALSIATPSKYQLAKTALSSCAAISKIKEFLKGKASPPYESSDYVPSTTTSKPAIPLPPQPA
ncbi:hypothetical protein HY989_00400 [Candidatus Micrarchaeota archaeon]|nr:hypothetical protein [Candidatus Micrarchaeota archaeon]